MLSVVFNYLNVITFWNGLLRVLMVIGHEVVHEAWTYVSFPQLLLLDSNNYVTSTRLYDGLADSTLPFMPLKGAWGGVVVKALRY
jgi:hypothetical protein